MQTGLFEEPDPPTPAPRPRAAGKVQPAVPAAGLAELAARLPAHLRLGTSSWSFPGWVGTVWDREYPDSALSRHGLRAYSQHPLLRAVSLDRVFYRALETRQYAAYAAQVPEDFRFVVKAPSLVADAQMRDEGGRGQQLNGGFLDPELALRSFVEPALEGLGPRLGALVFQLSPLPGALLGRMPELIERLHALLRRIPALHPRAPDAVVAVEVRDPEWLCPAFTQALKDTGATYCLGLHPKMPTLQEQLPVLRALWPGPLVCRWNLNPRHGAYGYEQARQQYAPFDRIVDPDPDTRATLARVIAGTAGALRHVYVTVNNKAEGSAPLSVVALAEAVVERLGR